jgi:hypothetical protein
MGLTLAAPPAATNQLAPSHAMPQAGPSNHPGRLRSITPPSGSQFEDLGTIAGTPRTAVAGDDSADDVERMQLEEDDGPDDLYGP